MSEPVVIENRPFWPRVMVAFWALEAVMGLVFAALGASWLGGGENGAPVLMIVMGLALSFIGAVLTHVVWRAAWLKGVAIAASAHGFQDRRLSDMEIGWDHLQWKTVFNGRNWSVQFNVAEEQRRQYRVGWGNRMLAVFNRAFRYPEFTVMTLGTGQNAVQLGALLSRFKAPQD